ncbi:MAG TPA: FHA domain-containing protein [Anaeromyxobacteraceae bacterium]|nr:FHA domain-containing protein [Anaeromyxobacteraceae bacterium]
MSIMDETRVGNAPQSSGAVAAPRAVLAVVHASNEGEAGKRYPVHEEDVTLGREEGNTIVVASDQASRRHARIFVSGGNHVLVDLESTNGTFLNSKPMKEQTLRHGDVIRIGTAVYKYLVEG